ncbi:MAG TPA: tetratricopeptide repeat protein [Terriglobia bacterium]|nr:tetratricopeptide repeat protein [Terriglobia bacterium]
MLIAPSMASALARSRAQAFTEIQQLIQQGSLAEAERQLTEALKEFPKDAALHDLRGVVEAEKQNYHSAESEFRKAIELDPLLAGAYLNLGHLYQQNGADDRDAAQKALAVYEKLLGFDPGNVEANYQSAVLIERRKSFRQSLDHLSRLPAPDQDKAQALSLRCADFAGLGDHAQADAAGDRLLKSPDLTEADVSLILPVLDANHWDDLEQGLLEGAVNRGLAGAELLEGLGRLYFRKGKLDDARATLERVATARPQSVDVLLELARVANEQNDHTGALGYLAHAREMDPQNPAIHFFFGMVSLEENLLEEAYESLRRAERLAPENAYYNYALGIVAQQRADPSEAVPYFRKYCALRPRDPRGRLQLGITYFESHQQELARNELESVVGFRETAAAAHFFLGRIANQEGKFSEALHELHQALEVEPNYADPLAEEGIIYMKQKEYAAAERALLHALAMDPAHYAANLNLMILYQRTGDGRAEAQAKRFEEVKQERAKNAKLALRSIEIVR